MIVQAMGGIMSITGNKNNEYCRVGSSIGDIVAGLYAVIGILTQIIFRQQTKKGSRLDLSMLDCQVAILENAVTRYSVEKKIPKPLGTDHPSISPFGAFKTLDGTLVIAIGNDKMFKNFCNIIKAKNLFKNQGDIQIWISDDQKRLPVKIQIKMKFGSMTLLLKKVI